MKGFTTKALHGDLKRTDPHGALRYPMYDSVSFEFADSESIEDAFRGRKPAHSYSRITNPTVQDFENRINFLAEGLGTIAVSSGMAAISNVIMAICQGGDNIITTKYLFGNTYSLLERTLKPWGLEVRYLDLGNPEELEQAIDDKTRIIFLESITNPQLAVFDLEEISRIAQKHRVVTVLDNTVTTPYLLRAKKWGMNIEIVSTTKYISGGATSVGGVIIDHGNFPWEAVAKLEEDSRRFGPHTLLMKLRREVYRNLGACLSAHNAYLQTLGLETIVPRIQRSCENASKLAEFLSRQKGVKKVNYPGLETSPHHFRAKKILEDLYGGILTFELANQEECCRLMDRLKIIRRATNLNDNKTLIIHPASTIYCEYDEETKESLGVNSRMLRLAVGIEDYPDLQEELETALEGS